MTNLVLASSSPYRKQLLHKLRLDFVACPANIDESPLNNETGEKMAVRLALAKARKAAERYPKHLIIASDQTAMLGLRHLRKPGDKDAAFEQLAAQSGRTVDFHTGLCVLDSATGRHLTALDTCRVSFRRLSDEQIRHYLELEKPFDCAGSFKSEGLGIALFERIEGEDPNSLVGLPLIKLVTLLQAFGHPVI